MGTLVVLPIISFIGSRYNRPRILAYGSLILLCGLCLKILPHFITGPYEYTDVITASNSTADVEDTMTDQLVCNVFNESGVTPPAPSCDSKEHEDIAVTSNVYSWMIVGSILMGIGGAALSPLGISYMDDHTNRHDAALYIGIMMTIGFIGPLLGNLLGSSMLQIWVDFLITDVSILGVKPRDPAWVGAWWLGFAICLCISFLSSIPFWFFPKKMNVKNSSPSNQNPEGISSETATENEAAPNDAISFKEFFRTLKLLFTNKLFVTIIILMTLVGFEVSGYITFLTKYIEVAFGKSAAESSLLVGTITMPFVIIGAVVGSVVVKCCKLNFLGNIRFMTITCLLRLGGFFILLNLGCTPTTHVGIDIPYPGNLSISSDYGMNNTGCNAGCYCQEKSYFPVCDDVTGSTFITPCHGGCSEYEMLPMAKIQNFTSCTCVEGLGRLTAGRCSVAEDCDSKLRLVLAFFGFTNFVSSLPATSVTLVLIRSIDPRDKAFAIGMGVLMIRIFGWIPGPIIFGHFVDQACSFWTQKECSARNYCSIFDISLFRRNYFTILIVIVIFQCVLSIAIEFIGKGRMKKEEEHSAQCEAAADATL